MHRTITRFWKCFKNLPESVQKLSKKNFELLKADPSHPSLHFKKVSKFWSVRAGMNHRALAIEDGQDFIWVKSAGKSLGLINFMHNLLQPIATECQRG